MLPICNLNVAPMPEVPLYSGDPDFRVLGEKKHQPVVLVVDDERVIADTVSLILKRSGFTVLTAYDARSALELANAIPPDLLLTDYTMAPEMNGVDLALELVKLVPECKILLFSAQVGTMDILADARKAGHSFALLAKPVPPSELLAHVTEFLEAA